MPSNWASVWRQCAGMVIGMGCCVAPHAKPIEVLALGCAHGVHLVASGARASEVLQRLASTLNFELSFEGRLDAIVSIDAAGAPEGLIARVLNSEGFMIVRRLDPRCPGKTRIVSVHVVAPSALPAVGTPSKPQRAAAPQIEPSAGEIAFLKAHGVMLAASGAAP